jgi:tetratricopeptide (TPR) repeat protein
MRRLYQLSLAAGVVVALAVGMSSTLNSSIAVAQTQPRFQEVRTPYDLSKDERRLAVEQLRAIEQLMSAGQASHARAAMEALRASRVAPIHVISALRMVAYAEREQGSIDQSIGTVHEALTIINSGLLCDPSDSSMQRAWIASKLDLADIEAFERDNADVAVLLYDEVSMFALGNYPKSALVASRNAAMLLAQGQRFDDAVARGERILQSKPLVAELSPLGLVQLQASVASWATRSEQYDLARTLHSAVWQSSVDGADDLAIGSGLALVRWFAPGEACAERMQLLTDLATRLASSRSAIDPAIASRLESDLLVRWADSSSCNDPSGNVGRARAQLGLRP